MLCQRCYFFKYRMIRFAPPQPLVRATGDSLRVLSEQSVLRVSILRALQDRKVRPVGANSETYRNFVGVNGLAAAPLLIRFTTAP